LLDVHIIIDYLLIISISIDISVSISISVEIVSAIIKCQYSLTLTSLKSFILDNFIFILIRVIIILMFSILLSFPPQPKRLP